MNDDILTQIMEYEDGEMDADQVLDFFCELLNTGLVWHLQGSYQRQATYFLNTGRIKEVATRTGGREFLIGEMEDES